MEGGFGHDHDIDDTYISEELESRAKWDSDFDGGCDRRVLKFREEDMCKDFKWKIGMDFSSLKQFKDAILEHSVLNCKKVKFVKNDQVYVRVVCEANCQFVAYVS